jgi:hypothetical protein
MDPDLMLVVGILLGVLSVPSILSAFSEGRAPRAASIVLLIGGTLLVLALTQKPSGYTFDEIIMAFRNVFSRLLS